MYSSEANDGNGITRKWCFIEERNSFCERTKKKGEDVIYKVDLFEKGLALRSVAYDTGGSSPFTIESEKVGKYYHDGYDIYARIKEIDDSDLDYCGMASIKYDIIVLDED